MNASHPQDHPPAPLADRKSEDAIVVDHLVKQFRVRHQGSFKQAVLGVRRKKSVERPAVLNDVSFRVPHGQTVAVIGRNGSGKSTLLGILARVYLPTSGAAYLANREGGPPRIAPLLDLSSGFHPDLTGLQNIEFYGAILGLSSRELREKRDSIVAFAELEEKVDTIMRGWNEGAKLRLGFSIAIHIDPDILLVDEVLAVGDEAFQEKCFRRIGQLQAEGKTILFVSHDLPVVARVAQRVIWLHEGRIRCDGEPSEVLTAYHRAFVPEGGDSPAASEKAT